MAATGKAVWYGKCCLANVQMCKYLSLNEFYKIISSCSCFIYFYLCTFYLYLNELNGNYLNMLDYYNEYIIMTIMIMLQIHT